jgi:hypothetical protein
VSTKVDTYQQQQKSVEGDLTHPADPQKSQLLTLLLFRLLPLWVPGGSPAGPPFTAAVAAGPRPVGSRR